MPKADGLYLCFVQWISEGGYCADTRCYSSSVALYQCFQSLKSLLADFWILPITHTHTQETRNNILVCLCVRVGTVDLHADVHSPESASRQCIVQACRCAQTMLSCETRGWINWNLNEQKAQMYKSSNVMIKSEREDDWVQFCDRRWRGNTFSFIQRVQTGFIQILNTK